MQNTTVTETVPSPLMVGYAKQRANARTLSERYANARKNGVRGPLTRNDLAAIALRNSR